MKNREIKFRAWDGKRMIYDGEEGTHTIGIAGYMVTNNSVQYYDESSDVFFWRDLFDDYTNVVFMPSVGIQDKTSKDLYESDIKEDGAVCIWDDFNCRYQWRYRCGHKENVINNKRFTIIGNIHEKGE